MAYVRETNNPQNSLIRYSVSIFFPESMGDLSTYGTLQPFASSFGYGPFPVTVTTRIVTFIVENPFETFICHCYWEGATPYSSCSCFIFPFGYVSSLDILASTLSDPPLRGTRSSGTVTCWLLKSPKPLGFLGFAWMSREVSKWLVNGLQPSYKWGILGL